MISDRTDARPMQHAAARLRRLLARRLAVLGRRRGNPFRRLAAVVLRGPAKRRPGPAFTRLRPLIAPLIGPDAFSPLGLGLAGGGGGSPGGRAI